MPKMAIKLQKQNTQLHNNNYSNNNGLLPYGRNLLHDNGGKNNN